jgi:hypothetical protein
MSDALRDDAGNPKVRFRLAGSDLAEELTASLKEIDEARL